MFACKKSDLDQSKSLSALDGELTVKNAMLHFKSKGQFDSELQKFDKMTLAELDSHLKQFDFLSYKQDTISEREEDVTADPVFKRIFNQNAAIQIGDTIVILGLDKDILIKNGDFETYSNIVSQKRDSHLSTENIEYVEVKSSRSQNLINTEAFSSNNLQQVNSISTEGVVAAFPPPSSILNYTTYTFDGAFEIFSPNTNASSSGRTERIKFIIYEEYRGFGSYRAGVTAQGEAWRKGGAFGKKKWRDDEINWLKATMSSIALADGRPFAGPFPTVTTWNEMKEIAIITQNTLSGGPVTFTNLSLKLELKKQPADPIHTLNFNIQITQPGTLYRSLTVGKTW